jgi:hypothetical protein
MNGKMTASALFAALLMLAYAGVAGAVDGTIEINQAKVTASGGFPYIITTSGSYRLTSNLTVSATNTDAIDANQNYVTIDLNGFSISGPGTGSGIGINSQSLSATTVKNGMIIGFGSGVSLGAFSVVRSITATNNDTGTKVGIAVGNSSTVEGCTANSNIGGTGILCNGSLCVITGNTASTNATGISCTSACVISGNSANGNTSNGIDCSGSSCVVSGNTSTFNTNRGIEASDSTTGYGGNVMYDDFGTTTAGAGCVAGGTSLGNNLCNGQLK